ncbi:hypothetical protein ACT009_16855 [Sphingomonas sp. Tas61C01]|uniref:hypothetical protein n=1 Tax=Sphingomonas sp. Tas61C01 TaxID=3458297 RepID=UPI00403EB83F
MKNFITAFMSLTAAPAVAETIDFTPLAYSGDSTIPDRKYSSVVGGDYEFTALEPAFIPLIVRPSNNPNNADLGGATLGISTFGQALGFSFSRGRP